MATMTDVAKYAKVSKMTVSRVLNGTGYVKEETRTAVLEAVRALHYRPNLLAKSLATGRTNILAYVVPDICDPYFGHVCKGITEACDKLGYNSIVYNAPSPKSIDRVLDLIIDRNIDGCIFHHLALTQKQVERLRSHNIKCALIDNEVPLENVLAVENDNRGGARQAAEYLFACGYRRIAFICGTTPEDVPPPRNASYLETLQRRIWYLRRDGFLEGLRAHGLEPFAMYYGRGSADLETAFASGQQIVQEMLRQPALPDAVYCSSDLIALGVSSELLETGRHMGICGHDGLDTCCHLFPRVTTIVQPQYDLGHQAAVSLIGDVRGEPCERQLTLPSTLFVGDTTKKPSV